jgi:SRSO17 transposase
LSPCGCARPGSSSAGPPEARAGSFRCAGCWPSGPLASLSRSQYWLANLPDATPIVELVRFAKLRWRVEHDYRELKDALGLDHFEGRSFKGWQHHVTLVSVAHAFVTLQRLDPKAAAPV